MYAGISQPMPFRRDYRNNNIVNFSNILSKQAMSHNVNIRQH